MPSGKFLMLIGDSLPEKSGRFPDRQTTANMLSRGLMLDPQNEDLFHFRKISQDFRPEILEKHDQRENDMKTDSTRTTL